MKIRVKIGDGEHEVDASDIQLPDGHQIIDKQSPPDGLFTQAALDAKVKEINSRKTEKARQELMKDDTFKRDILSEFNIKLDDSGNPVGLKPDFDPEEWKRTNLPKLTEPIKREKEELEKRYERTKKGRIADAILAATKGSWQEQYTKPLDGGRVQPLAVKHTMDLFDEDDDGNIVLKDKDGDGFALDQSGERITPDKYLTDESKFGDFLQDKRQRGSGFQSGGRNGKQVFTGDQIGKMSDSEYAKHREDIQKASAEGRVQK